MRPIEPPARFLLRGSAALAVLSAVWWFFLVTPLLSVFRQATDFFGGLLLGRASCEFVTEAATGDRHFCIAVDMAAPGTAGQAPARIHSLEFDMARTGAVAFTFGLPVYWALLLASPRCRRPAWSMAAGTVLTALLELLALVLLIATDVHAVAEGSANPGAAHWSYSFTQYLAESVAPTMSPFAVALLLGPELRNEIFGWVRVQETPAPQPRLGRARRNGKLTPSRGR